MYKLLNAGFSRMKKNKVLFMIIIITIGFASFLILNNMSAHIGQIDYLLYNYSYIIGLFMAMFTSLFTGTEYSYGTIRNKIIVGHNRKNIYLSNLIFSIVSGIIFQMIYWLIIILFGTILIGSIVMPLSDLLLLFLAMLFVITAYSSIFNLITLLSSDVTVATTVCMLLFLAMFVFSSTISSVINIPEYIDHTMTDEYGNVQIIERKPNPNYPSKMKRDVSKFLCYIIPTSSSMQLSGGINDIDNVTLFSHLTLTIVLFNGIGIYLFNKKDLK